MYAIGAFVGSRYSWRDLLARVRLPGVLAVARSIPEDL